MVITLLLISILSGLTIREDFSTKDYFDPQTTASWDTTNETLHLSKDRYWILYYEEYQTNLKGSYEFGWRFRPLRNGKVIALGRYKPAEVSGIERVKLWSDDGVLLASCTVTGGTGWNYVYLSVPVEVSSSTFYRVSVWCEEGFSVFNTTSPTVRRDIYIDSFWKSSKEGFPDSEAVGLFGAPDFIFETYYNTQEFAISLPYDTGVEEPDYLSFSSSHSLNGGSINFYFQSSFDGNTWSSWESDFAVLPNWRYFRWKAELSTPDEKFTPFIYFIDFKYNTPPEPGNLLSPENESFKNSLKLNFEWEDGYDLDGDTVSYSLYLSTDSNFNYIFYTSATFNRSLLVENLFTGSIYWKVRVSDGSLYSDSEVFRVCVDTVPPEKIINLKAETGEKNGEIRLQWTSPYDFPFKILDEFRIYYTSSTLFEEIIISTSTSSGEIHTYVVNNLQDATTYLFKIMAKDKAGNFSELSGALYGFTNAPPNVYFINPVGGETLSGTIEIKWDSVDPNKDDEVYYNLYYSSNQGKSFIKLVENYTLKSYSWDTLYYPNGPWHVLKIEGIDKRGLKGESVTDVFTIENENYPPQVSISSPTEGNVYSGDISLKWSVYDKNPYDFHYFNVYIFKDSEYTLIASSITTLEYPLDTTLFQDSTSYFLKVEASDGISSSYTITGPFSIFNNNHSPVAPSLISPKDGEIVKIARPTFSWNEAFEPDWMFGDRIKSYTFYLKGENLFYYKEGLSTNTFTINQDLEDNATYTWWIEVYDTFSLSTQTQKNVFYVEHLRAVSDDKNVEAVLLEDISPYSSVEIETENIEEYDVFLKPAYSKVYKVILKGEEENKMVKVLFNIPDFDNDGISDEGLPVENISLYFWDGEWRVAEDVSIEESRISGVVYSGKKVAIFYQPDPQEEITEIVNFPNPFSDKTYIQFRMKEEKKVEIKIYSISGEIVFRKSFTGKSGLNTYIWDGKNSKGEKLTSGMYILFLKVGDNERKRLIGIVR